VTIRGLGGLTSSEDNRKHINHMKRKVTIAFLALALTGLSFRTGAQDKEPAVNPTGTWKSTIFSATGQPASSQTLKIKLEGGKLTGTLSRQAGSKVEQLPLEDAKLKGSDISFATLNYAVSYVNNVLQPTDTNKWSHSKYQGTISGDTIKGKIERKSWNTENSRTLDWEGRRVKATTQ
jgi:hypothetical protein